MSASTYLRRLLIGFGILIALVIVSPLALMDGVHVLCAGNMGGGCGDLGILLIIFGGMPALIGILCFIGWAAFRRLRALEFSLGYIIFPCLLLAGCFQCIIFAGPSARMGYMGWDIIGPPLLTTMILAAICWVPEASERGAPNPVLQNALIVVSVLLLLRFAEAILYPLGLFPSGFSLSSALRHVAYLGPLKLVPNAVLIVTFATLFLLTFKQWRDPHRKATA